MFMCDCLIAQLLCELTSIQYISHQPNYLYHRLNARSSLKEKHMKTGTTASSFGSFQMSAPKAFGSTSRDAGRVEFGLHSHEAVVGYKKRHRY